MNTSTVKLYSLDYKEAKTYIIAMMFVVGNILFPQLCHTVNLGGPTWLPIYFFTLVGAYKYGWKVGLLTAILSPVINSMFFGMPAPQVLPAILGKSVLLAVMAGYTANRFKRISILLLLAVVLGYQIAGSILEWALTGSIYTAIQDFRIGIPGIALQIFGGYFFIKYLIRR